MGVRNKPMYKGEVGNNSKSWRLNIGGEPALLAVRLTTVERGEEAPELF